MPSLSDEQFFEIKNDNEFIRVRVRRTPRAKRISLKVSSHHGVELVLPMRASLRKAMGFTQEKHSWIAAQLSRLPDRRQFTPQSTIILFGKSFALQYQPDISCLPRLNENSIQIGGTEALLHQNMKTYLKRLAKERFTPVAHDFAEKLGVKISNISVRDMRSRWGSCSIDGRISLCWRLVMAPEEVAAYVIAHEIAHLKVMDHSKRFWQVVESIYPDYKTPRTWLKQNGTALQIYE